MNGGRISMKEFFGRISKRNRIIIGIIAVVLVGLVLILGAGRRGSASSSTFQTVQVQRGQLTATVGATGSVRAQQSATLNWQISGTVETVNVKVGDQVNKNDVLASLSQASLPQNIILAQADLVSAQKALDNLVHSDTSRSQAAVDLKTAQDAYQKAYNYRQSLNGVTWLQSVTLVYAHGRQVPVVKSYRGYVDAQTILKADNELALAKAKLDDAQRTFDSLKGGTNPDDLAAAQSKVFAAQSTLNMARIQAPFSGTVTQASPLPGDQVAAGKVAFRLDDLSNLLVDVQVSEVDINSISLGQPVTLTFDAIPARTYNGKVLQVSQAGDVTAGAVNFVVTVQLTDGDLLVKPGMTAAVSIIVNQVKDQLLIPNRTVRLLNGNHVVYVLVNGKAKELQITLGASSDTMSVVLSGPLKAGDLLILNPPSTGGGGPFGGGGG
jgi:HlyD family secretion protein